jgi:hypothetical protein
MTKFGQFRNKPAFALSRKAAAMGKGRESRKSPPSKPMAQRR